jgi:hypothetical protein
MKSALVDPKTISELRINREKYVLDETYIQDGKATKRVTLLIKEVLDKSTSNA